MISTCSPGWLIYSLVMTFILALAWGFSVGYRRGYIQCDIDSLRMKGINVPQGVKSTPESFWRSVDTGGEDDCWEWKLTRNDNGYGHVMYHNKMQKAHRLAWLLHHGSLDPNLDVLHTCDNPPCCNPRHLFLGTHTDNVADMIAKGRRFELRGQASGRSPFTEDRIRELRAMYVTGLYSYADLAKMEGVDRSCIRRIIRRETWTHV